MTSQTALSLTYAWIKAGHVIFVIFWIAGLFMLPRYYIYHQESAPGSAEEKKWIERERKLRNDHHHPGDDPGLDLRPDARLDHPGLDRCTGSSSSSLLVVALSGYHGWMIGYGRSSRGASGRSAARRSGS